MIQNSVHCEDFLRRYFNSGLIFLVVPEHFLTPFQTLKDSMRYLSLLVHDLKHRSSYIVILTVLEFTFSSSTLLHKNVVGSFAILVLRVLMKSWFHFLWALLLSGFCWMLLPISVVFFPLQNFKQRCISYGGGAFRVDLHWNKYDTCFLSCETLFPWYSWKIGVN